MSSEGVPETPIKCEDVEITVEELHAEGPSQSASGYAPSASSSIRMTEEEAESAGVFVGKVEHEPSTPDGRGERVGDAVGDDVPREDAGVGAHVEVGAEAGSRRGDAVDVRSGDPLALNANDWPTKDSTTFGPSRPVMTCDFTKFRSFAILKNGQSIDSADKARIVLPPLGKTCYVSPIVSSKLPVISPDKAATVSGNFKIAGPITLRPVGPRRTISVRSDAALRSPSETPDTLGNGNSDLDLLDRDEEEPTDDGDVATAGDGEEITSESVIARDEDRCVIEITGGVASLRAPAGVSGPSQEVGRRSCHCRFCGSALSREKRIIYLALDKPLPSSLLDPVSLLRRLGVSLGGVAAADADDATVVLCPRCYCLVSDGDRLYGRLASLSTEMREAWPDSGETLSIASGSDEAKRGVDPPVAPEGPVKTRPQSPPRKCRPILPKPSAPREPPSTRVGDFARLEARIKQEPSAYKMRICGFCGMDLYGEDDWTLHSAAVHRVERKWRMFNVQPTLKTLLAKEIQRSSRRGVEGGKRRCIACGREFSRRDEFVEHLRRHHNMAIDEEFLSYVSEDADIVEWSNSRLGGTTDAPVRVKREKSPASGTEATGRECGPSACEERDVATRNARGENEVRANAQPVKEVQADAPPVKELKADAPLAKELQAHAPTADRRSEGKQEIKGPVGRPETKGTAAPGVHRKFQGPTWCCRLCGELYGSKAELDRHKLSEHPGSVRVIKRRRIDEEEEKASKPVDARPIPPILRSKTKVSCRLCSKSFDSQEALGDHIDASHENSVVILERDGCGGVVDHRLDMSEALDPERPEAAESPRKTRSFACASCGEAFVNRLLLVKHRRAAHGDVGGVGGSSGLVMVECEVCGRRLHGIGSLRHHLSKAHNRSHRAPLKHRCKMCIYHARTRNQLEKHMQEKHGVSALPPVECKDCGKMYNAKYIDIHVANIHENRRMFSCNFCAMKFNIKSSLKCHISYEHANNRWRCDACDAEFDRYHKLRQHRIYVHSTKTFPCQECGKTYKRKSDLTTHGKRRHQERVPRECHHCPKAYTDQKKLRNHLIKKHGVAWEDTLSKSYARHQRENNCLKRRQARRAAQEAAAAGPYEKREPYYEREERGVGGGLYKEECLPDQQSYQGRHCSQLGEGTITTYEGADIGTVEDQREYNVVQVNEAPDSLTDVADISYIILEES